MFYILISNGSVTRDIKDAGESSNESSLESNNANESHRAILHIDLGSEENAQVVWKSVAVDKEPSRSTAERTYCVRGHHLIVDIVSLDMKYLQKSISNLFDMCYLAKQTIEQVSRYHLKVTSGNGNTTVKRSLKEMKVDNSC
uniref:L antigen family member 3 n=1 Tax=Setaria digitata TaxID=48799 RepID=A0A915PZR9_9BILA